MSNFTGAKLVTTIKLRSGRQNDTTLITTDFVLEALNEAQLQIVKMTPRIVSLDKSDTTTYRIDRWSTETTAVLTAVRASTGIVTLTSMAHGLEVGDIASVTGTSGIDTSFNGNFEILSVADADTVTYFSNLDDEAATTLGTIVKLYAKATLDITTLNPAHIGGVWILNDGSTRQVGLKYRELTDFRRKYIPVSNEGGGEPFEYTREGGTLLLNMPISRDSQGLRFQIDYTAFAKDLENDGEVSELPNSNKGLILFGLAEVYDEIALSMPRFESKALKTRVLYDRWFEDYQDYQTSLIEVLYGANPW